ncbi:NADPH-dependent FMN reductase [Actinomycetota bacterium]
MSTLVIEAGSSPSSSTAALAQVVARDAPVSLGAVGLVPVRDMDVAELVDRMSPAAGELVELVAAAGAVLIVTPVYHASFSGLCKVALDCLPRTALTGKVVAVFGTSGSAVGKAALAPAVLPVLHALGARRVASIACFSAADWASPGIALQPEAAMRLCSGLHEVAALQPDPAAVSHSRLTSAATDGSRHPVRQHTPPGRPQAQELTRDH